MIITFTSIDADEKYSSPLVAGETRTFMHQHSGQAFRPRLIYADLSPHEFKLWNFRIDKQDQLLSAVLVSFFDKQSWGFMDIDTDIIKPSSMVEIVVSNLSSNPLHFRLMLAERESDFDNY